MQYPKHDPQGQRGLQLHQNEISKKYFYPESLNLTADVLNLPVVSALQSNSPAPVKKFYTDNMLQFIE